MSEMPLKGKWITPPEADEIAGQYRNAANEIRAIAQRVSGVGNRLDGSWLGNSKNIFDSHFNSFPNDITAYADMLDQMAHEISKIQVWVEVDDGQG